MTKAFPCRGVPIVDIYSKAKGCFTIYDTVAGGVLSLVKSYAPSSKSEASESRTNIYRLCRDWFSVKREASESKNERRSALP
jgi:hypothetical protein